MEAKDWPTRQEVKVLSAKGHKYEVPAADRDKLCLLSDGSLYVASAYQRDMSVLSYADLLRRHGVGFQIKIVSVEEIQQQYTAIDVTGAEHVDATHRQMEVLRYITEAVKLGASDLHFRNEEKSTKLYMRIDGFLELIHSLKAVDGQEICATMYASMCDEAESQYNPRKSQDGRLKAEVLEKCGLFGARIATRPRNYGNLVVLRLLYNSGRKKTLKELGFDEVLQVPYIRRMTRRTTGINIFSGPTGSGKSTSLDALLSELLSQFENRIHLLTIEDPIEYEMPHAVQTPLICDRKDPSAVAREWARAISNAMRLDPDTIMVGEMRDKDSAATAFRAAMTGHGVWTTLHANNALHSLDRLIDIGVSESFVTDASLVTGLINQSLVAVNCKQCRRPYLRNKGDIDANLQQRIERFCKPERVFLRGADRGCQDCNGKGYRGRTVIAECCMPNQAIMNAYRRHGAAEAKSLWVKKYNGMTKNAHLIHKINLGLVDPAVGEQKVCALDEDELTLI